MTHRMSWRAFPLLLALALVAVACGGDGDGADITTIATTAATQTPSDATDEAAMDDGETAESGTATTEAQATDAGEASAPGTSGSGAFGLDPVDPLSVSGDVAVAGSSTVFPLAEAMAARFEDEGYSGLITIDSIGSGAGFERFCVAGESDVSNASRPIKDAEVESCRAIGRDPIEFRVGTDALAVTVSPGNTFVTDLTVEELSVLFSTATTWQDVRAEFPANAIQRFIPGTDSGTFDYFVEEVFDEDEGPILAAGNTQLSEDDNVLVQGISGDGCDPSSVSTTCAVGFFGYAYYSENSDRLSVLDIEGVEPTVDSVNANTYPLARPLFMYSTASIIAEKPQVGAFLSFVLQFVNEEIGEVGYFPAPDAVLQAAANELHAAITGEAMTMMADEGLWGLPVVDPLSVSGDVAVAGSSTVFPLAEAMAARFEDEGYSGLITIDSIGSGAGFERFCVAGESDVSNASRPIKDAEVESCRAIGRDPIEFRVGTDALAVTVSPGNTFVTDLTVEELSVLFSTATTWQDVRAEFPANAIQRFIPGTDSGTFDYFVEEVFDEDEGPILAAGNTQLSEDDNVLVQGISGDGCDPSSVSTTCAVGFFGYAYYSENSDRLSVLDIEGVEPTVDSVNANTYPLARPLFMYSTASIIAEKPQVGAFLSFVLQFVNEEIGEVGYFPAPDAVLQAAADELGAAL